jgi:hypothetical protein
VCQDLPIAGVVREQTLSDEAVDLALEQLDGDADGAFATALAE